MNKERIQGKIYHINRNGYGFISTEEMKFTRIFFHWQSLKNTTKKFTELKRGMLVEFELLDRGEQGWAAIKIEVIDEPLIKEARVERIK